MTSEITVRARAFVEEHTPEARGLGLALGELVDDPEAFVANLQQGLERLSDPAYASEQERVAPGSGAVIGVRWPLVRAVARQVAASLRECSSATAISLAQRLVRADVREIRLFAIVPIERSLGDDPERTWQVLRQLARAANDWISVDSIADLVARGVLLEPFRWAELEQLVYSRSPWERRLVGATVARMPFTVTTHLRPQLDGQRGLMLIKSLMGDADPNVQKALSWALREWTRVDAEGVSRLLADEATLAARNEDGHRAWVIRDSLERQAPAVASMLRARLEGVRRRPGAPSTSEAARATAEFFGEGHVSDAADIVVGQQGERQARAQGMRGAA